MASYATVTSAGAPEILPQERTGTASSVLTGKD